MDDDAYTELCRSASDDLVIFYLEHRLTCPTAKEFKFLLKRKNPQIIKVLDKCFDDFFDTEMLKLLLKEMMTDYCRPLLKPEQRGMSRYPMKCGTACLPQRRGKNC